MYNKASPSSSSNDTLISQTTNKQTHNQMSPTNSNLRESNINDSARDFFTRLEKLHTDLDVNGTWVSTPELGDDYNAYMESFGHNVLSLAIVSNFMKEIHEYHFFVEELRIKIETSFNEFSYSVKVNGKTVNMPYCYFFDRSSRFYITGDNKLAEEIVTNGERETIVRERKGDKLILTYTHNDVTWVRTFEKANEQNLKKGTC